MSGGAEILDVFALAHSLASRELTEEAVEYLYGEEALTLAKRILSDPFEEVLGG